MHPYWHKPLQYVKGIGEQRAALLARELGLHTLQDMPYCLPRRYADRSQAVTIASLVGGVPPGPVLLRGRLHAIGQRRQGPRPILTAQLHDATGHAELVWFQGIRGVLPRLKEGAEVLAYGRVVLYRHRPQMAHPELEWPETAAAEPTLGLQPVYPGTDALRLAGLDGRALRQLVARVLAEAPEPLPDPLPGHLRHTHQLMNLYPALVAVHQPPDGPTLEAARRRLKWDELFSLQCLLALRRSAASTARRSALPFTQVGPLFNRFYHEVLPFQLTEGQKQALREVRADLAHDHPANRLIQGDVGSGKTLVAAMALLLALDNGCQAALLAPTEILAEQHLRSLQRWLEPMGVAVSLLTGSTRPATRRELLYGLATGSLPVVVGTHALLEPTVQFQRLGLTIIDEQHKFGVRQRAQLRLKGPKPTQGKRLVPHNLLLTATPIPRTLALTLYGDMETSTIKDLPPGRQPIRTVVRGEGSRLRVWGFMQKEISAGHQVYVVYPAVEENAREDLKAVEDGYHVLTNNTYRWAVGILHGKMASEAKDYEMQRFLKGETQVLVATTVIEVGVDVPNASVMVIENAERFGLSQLHQLRGRVGRGSAQSYCILMAGPRASEEARRRLDLLATHADGFAIAELDLQLRGPGDFMGTRQSGLPELKLANLVTDGPLLEEARQAALALVAADPQLARPEHQPWAQHLRGFQHQHALSLWLA